MFEHVGAAHYDEFFAKCRDLLAPDGVMLLHTIGRLGAAALNPDPFIAKYIFPGYHLPSLSQMSEASQKARLIASDVETLRLHYAYTLREWTKRTQAAKAADRRAVRRALLPAVGILSRRVGDAVRDRVGVQLPGAIYPRPPRAADHARLYGRGRGAVSRVWGGSGAPARAGARGGLLGQLSAECAAGEFGIVDVDVEVAPDSR